MKKVKLNRLSIISLILISIVVIILVANALTGNRIIGPIYRTIINRLNGIDIESVMSYVVYDNSQYFDNDTDTNTIKVLVEFNNENGIDYIISPNGKKINVNGKNKLAVDWATSYNANENFIIKLKDQEEINKTLNIKQEDVNNQFEVSVEETENGYVNKVSYSFKKEGDSNYYTIGDNFWTNYNTENMLIDYTKILPNQTSEYEGVVNIDLKKVDKNGNTVYVNKTATVYSNKIYYFFHVNRLGATGAGLSYSLQGGRENGAYEDYNTINVFDAQLGAYHGSWQGGYTADIIVDIAKFSESVDLSPAKNAVSKVHLAAYNGSSYSNANITTEYTNGKSITSQNQGISANGEKDCDFSTKMPVVYSISKITIHIWGLDNSNGWAGGWLSSLYFEIGEKELKTITFNANEGKFEDGTSSKSIETANEVITLPSVSRDGYLFDGWYYNNSGQEVFAGTKGQEFVFNETISLYAKWANTFSNQIATSNNDTHIIRNGFGSTGGYDGTGPYSPRYAFDGVYDIKCAGGASIGQWIGWDFKEPVYLVEAKGRIRMKGYIIKYADSTSGPWYNAGAGTLPGSERGDDFSLKPANPEALGKHQYWVLCVNGGQKTSGWGPLVFELNFIVCK